MEDCRPKIQTLSEMMSAESQIALKEKLKSAKVEREVRAYLKKFEEENAEEQQKCWLDLITWGVSKHKIVDGKLIRVHPFAE